MGGKEGAKKLSQESEICETVVERRREAGRGYRESADTKEIKSQEASGVNCTSCWNQIKSQNSEEISNSDDLGGELTATPYFCQM